jgi:hypothetical protein
MDAIIISAGSPGENAMCVAVAVGVGVDVLV